MTLFVSSNLQLTAAALATAAQSLLVMVPLLHFFLLYLLIHGFVYALNGYDFFSPSLLIEQASTTEIECAVIFHSVMK